MTGGSTISEQRRGSGVRDNGGRPGRASGSGSADHASVVEAEPLSPDSAAPGKKTDEKITTKMKNLAEKITDDADLLYHEKPPKVEVESQANAQDLHQRPAVLLSARPPVNNRVISIADIVDEEKSSGSESSEMSDGANELKDDFSDDDFLEFVPDDLYEFDEWDYIKDKRERIDELLRSLQTDKRSNVIQKMHEFFETKLRAIDSNNQMLDAMENSHEHFLEDLDSNYKIVQDKLESRDMETFTILNTFARRLGQSREDKKKKERDDAWRAMMLKNPGRKPSKSESKQGDGGLSTIMALQDRLKRTQQQVANSIKNPGDGNAPDAADLLQVISAQQDEVAALGARLQLNEGRVDAYAQAVQCVRSGTEPSPGTGILELLLEMKRQMQEEKLRDILSGKVSLDSVPGCSLTMIASLPAELAELMSEGAGARDAVREIRELGRECRDIEDELNEIMEVAEREKLLMAELRDLKIKAGIADVQSPKSPSKNAFAALSGKFVETIQFQKSMTKGEMEPVEGEAASSDARPASPKSPKSPKGSSKNKRKKGNAIEEVAAEPMSKGAQKRIEQEKKLAVEVMQYESMIGTMSATLSAIEEEKLRVIPIFGKMADQQKEEAPTTGKGRKAVVSSSSKTLDADTSGSGPSTEPESRKSQKQIVTSRKKMNNGTSSTSIEDHVVKAPRVTNLPTDSETQSETLSLLEAEGRRLQEALPQSQKELDELRAVQTEMDARISKLRKQLEELEAEHKELTKSSGKGATTGNEGVGEGSEDYAAKLEALNQKILSAERAIHECEEATKRDEMATHNATEEFKAIEPQLNKLKQVNKNLEKQERYSESKKLRKSHTLKSASSFTSNGSDGKPKNESLSEKASADHSASGSKPEGTGTSPADTQNADGAVKNVKGSQATGGAGASGGAGESAAGESDRRAGENSDGDSHNSKRKTISGKQRKSLSAKSFSSGDLEDVKESKQTEEEAEKKRKAEEEILHDIRELKDLKQERLDVEKQTQLIEDQIKKMKDNSGGGGEKHVDLSAFKDEAKAAETVPEENLTLRKEVVRKQKELNALRKQWWAKKDDDKDPKKRPTAAGAAAGGAAGAGDSRSMTKRSTISLSGLDQPDAASTAAHPSDQYHNVRNTIMGTRGSQAHPPLGRKSMGFGGKLGWGAIKEAFGYQSGNEVQEKQPALAMVVGGLNSAKLGKLDAKLDAELGKGKGHKVQFGETEPASGSLPDEDVRSPSKKLKSTIRAMLAVSGTSSGGLASNLKSLMVKNQSPDEVPRSKSPKPSALASRITHAPGTNRTTQVEHGRATQHSHTSPALGGDAKSLHWSSASGSNDVEARRTVVQQSPVRHTNFGSSGSPRSHSPVSRHTNFGNSGSPRSHSPVANQSTRHTRRGKSMFSMLGDDD